MSQSALTLLRPKSASPSASGFTPTLAISDAAGSSSPADYAHEVGQLVKAARSPLAIAGGLAIGTGAGYGVYRLRKGASQSLVLPASAGIFSAIISHAFISWMSYRKSGGALSDQGAELMSTGAKALDSRATSLTEMDKRAKEFASAFAQRQKAMMHPVSIGAGVGAMVAGTYGLYKWRNPKGATKQRWVLPVIGGLLIGGTAQGLAAAIMSSTATPATLQNNMQDGAAVGDLFDFSSITSSVVTAASLVCLYGGGKYLYDSWYRPRRKASRGLGSGLKDKAAPSNTPRENKAQSIGSKPTTASVSRKAASEALLPKVVA